MALNIEDPESEHLAGEIAALTGESKTGAIRTALRERRERLRLTETAGERRARLERSLSEIWSQVPPGKLGGPPLTRAEREEILGLGPEGT